MSADNVTRFPMGLCPLLQTLANDVHELALDVPEDNQAPGWRVRDTTRDDLRHVVKLLQEARELLRKAVDCESDDYDEHCQRLEAQGIEF